MGKGSNYEEKKQFVGIIKKIKSNGELQKQKVQMIERVH